MHEGYRQWRGYSVRFFSSAGNGIYASCERPPASASVFEKFAYLIRSLFRLQGGQCWKLSIDDTTDVYTELGCRASSTGHTATSAAGRMAGPAAVQPWPSNAESGPAPVPAREAVQEAVQEAVREAVQVAASSRRPSFQPRNGRISQLVHADRDGEASPGTSGREMQADGPAPEQVSPDSPVPATRPRGRASRVERSVAMPPPIPPCTPAVEAATTPTTMPPTAAVDAPERPTGAQEAIEAASGSEPLQRLAGRLRRCSADALRRVVSTICSVPDNGKDLIAAVAPFAASARSEQAEAPPLPRLQLEMQAWQTVETTRVVRDKPLVDFAARLMCACNREGDDRTVAAGLLDCIASLSACHSSLRPDAAVILLECMAQWLSNPRQRQSPQLLLLAGSVLEQGLSCNDANDQALAFRLQTLPARLQNAPAALVLALAIHLPQLPQESRVALMASLLQMPVTTPPSMAESIRILLEAYSAGSQRTFTRLVERVDSLSPRYQPLLLAAMASTLHHRPGFDRTEGGVAIVRACVALPTEGEGSPDPDGPGSMATIVSRVVRAMPALRGLARDTAVIDRLQACGDALPEARKRAFLQALWEALASSEPETVAQPAAGVGTE
ncbi:hypothetical protein [Cupriavidus sp. AU9028]|uniref:hypothetical protein n=1 Tax=Cupriavidus sp. AU9028 TaxID=2871157 RepID=UPI001C97BE75|nr:hypothetical protein [Cupriavidus sp. AU9028]MBY4898777.1 hypothetical protein [Cupriavidus sp. AU9028]